MTPQPKFKWWFVYGAPCTGSSYMISAIGTAAKKIISDWEVGNLHNMVGPPDQSQARPGIKFNWDEAFQSISENLLKNGLTGRGDQLDLAFKQANIKKSSYPSLIRMWGKPQRIIFCFRDPSSYMSSAMKKFPSSNVKGLQNMYLDSFNMYKLIGGDRFEYNSSCLEQDYIDFLSPLKVANKLPPFAYTGSDSSEYTPEMQNIFENFRQNTKQPRSKRVQVS